MKNCHVLIFLFFLCSYSNAYTSENNIIIEQAGNSNKANIKQYHGDYPTNQKSIESSLLQDKINSEDFQQQIINDPRISTYGRTKAAISGQFGEENAIPALKTKNQREAAPEAGKDSSDNDANTAAIEQSGGRNHVKSRQKGHATRLEVMQEGEENQIDREQEGDTNYFRKEQNGLAEEKIEQK